MVSRTGRLLIRGGVARRTLDRQRLQEGDRGLIRRAEHTVKFVHPPGYSYFAMLRQKLHWSEVL